ncbi:MAG TPA: hypothetical protein VGO67_16815 [Verrucomicrobiae bacterium]
MKTTIETKQQKQHENFETTRPLVSAAFATAILDCSRYHLLERIEDQKLPLAFDIAAPGVSRMCLRVASVNLQAVRSGLKPMEEFAKFFDSSFPAKEPHFGAPRLAWLMDCDYDHIYHLLKAKVLADAGNPTQYLIPRQSIFDFLTKRRLA